MANRLKRTINAAGTCMLVASAPLTSTAQTVPEPTPATVVASVLTPPVLLRIGGREVAVSLTDVPSVAATDPLSNGVRNGAIIGAIGAGTVFGVIAWRSCEDRLCAAGIPLIWAGIGAGCGALLGLTIDRAIETDSSTTQRGLRAVVAPVFSPRQKGLGVALRW
jgi:hypothetical protein